MINNKITHNKKRNVGLLYEFFSRYIAKALLENKTEDLEKAKSLIRKHFNTTTDLYKELKLFKMLYETEVSNKDFAIHLVNRVKEVVKTQSQSRLDLEKTSLIHEINQTLADNGFFNQNVPNYKILGTIQILLNSWRNTDLINENFDKIIEFELLLIEHLLTPKNINKNSTQVKNLPSNQNINKLVIDVMANKINKKFVSLNEEQKKIINLYMFKNEETKQELIDVLKKLNKKTIDYISENLKNNETTKFVEIKNLLENEYKNINENLNDDTITFYLGISKLTKELEK
jgi:galactitol-specific phosphotransferase system IIB component